MPRTSPILLISAAALFSISAGLPTFVDAQATASQPVVNIRPSVRVTQAVNARVTTTLAGTHPALIARATLGGRLAANTPLGHMRLVLSPSDDQALALRSLLDQQQDKTSPNYHKWLTPESFGQSFGVASADIARINAWLQDAGLKVESVSKSNRIITFTGTAAQVEAAFNTEIRHITVNGEAHVSNTSDISIPAAFAGVVTGVSALNDFRPKSDIVNPHKGEIVTQIPAQNYITTNADPLYTSVSSGAHYVGPGDAATIFNSTPLLSAGIDGTGQTIAVLGRSNITLSDVQQFRSMFGLKKNDPTITVIDNDPGVNGDDLEAYLDVEWSGGMAPGANVNFIVGGPDYYFSGGIDSAGYYAVENNKADIITLSYGGCETSNGAAGTAFYNTLWEQAASQGQTVFVSSGDSNATGCQSSSATYGTAYGVNALGSSAYNVAVGGSMFVDFNPSQYWAAGVAAPAPAGYTFSTATSYIPEAVWNEGKLATEYLNTAATATVTGSGIVGGGGGISIYTARPAWQTGSGISATADSTPTSGTGIAAGSPITGVHRLVPDISFIAASGHDATIFCGEGVCQNTNSGYGIGAIGGTSVATPVMASVQALINQKNGGRQGNANFFYYPLANVDYVAGNCKATVGTAANPTVTLPASTCNFHDIVAGGNNAPQNATDTTGLGFLATTGFDAATGLGSVNIANVANNWASVSFKATTTTFTLSPTSGIAHGVAQQLAVTVAPTSATGSPTGDISVIAETTNAGGPNTFTLTSGSYTGSLNGLPAGSYKVHVHYAGDGNFAPSDSASIPVVIGQEASTVTNTVHYILGTSIATAPTTVPFGSVLFINTNVLPTSSSTTTATGKLTYGVTLNGAALPSLVQTLDGYGDTDFQSGANSTPLYLNANYPPLAPGAYVITSSYSGDATYTASSTSSSFTVTKVAPVVSLTSSAANINVGQSVTLNYSVTRPASTTYVTPAVVQPTGSVTFTDTTSGAVLGTATVNAAGIASLSTTGITASGANAILAAYTGDNNYNTATSTATVTVGTLTATTTTFTTPSSSLFVGTTASLSATVSPAAAASVSFYDSGVLLGRATSNATTGVATLSYTGFTAGTHNLSAVFAGTTTYATSTGTATATVAQNVTSLVLDAPVASIYGNQIAFAGRINRSPSVANPAVGLTGTITFMVDGTAVTTATPVYLASYGFYTGTAAVATLTGGTHTFTATYSGDSNYAGSTSASVTSTIAKLTPTLNLTTTTGSSTYAPGSAVLLQVLIPAGTVLAAPTGTVAFTNTATNATYTATLSYSATLGGYVATINLGGLTGKNTYVATLSADTNYAAATSNPLTVTLTTNNVFVGNSNGGVTGVSQAGQTFGSQTIGGKGLSVDASGNVWSLTPSGNGLVEFNTGANTINYGTNAGGITAAKALTIGGAGYIWIANGNGTLSELSSVTGLAVSNTALTVPTSNPTAITVDASGNLWITNAGDNSVVQVIGAASPVLTPTTTAVKNNTLAVKP